MSIPPAIRLRSLDLDHVADCACGLGSAAMHFRNCMYVTVLPYVTFQSGMGQSRPGFWEAQL